MKLVLFFEVAKNELPIEYRRVFMHFIKETLSSIQDGELYEKYYSNCNRKDFTFSAFFAKPQFEKERVTFEGNRIKMYFSTSDTKLGFYFWNGFLAMKYKMIPIANCNEMKLVHVEKMREQTIDSDRALIKMLSPLVIRDHDRETNKDYYYSVGHDSFDEIATKLIRKQLQKCGYGQSYLDSFSIQKLDSKKIINRHYDLKLEVSVGCFEIEGNRLILNYLLKAGMGSRHSEGFGMFELVEIKQEEVIT